MSGSLGATLPIPTIPLADPRTGIVNHAWWYFFQRMLARTGGQSGTDTSTIQLTAENALNLSVLDINNDDPNVPLPDPAALALATNAFVLSVLDVETDDQMRNSPVALCFVVQDDAIVPLINPISAALMVSDPT